jgi:hypothetical protein
MADEQKVPAPVIEAPVKTEEAKPAGEINYGELISKLEKAGITEPKQLDGKLQAASERGHLANILGEVKNENAELKRMLMEMRAAQQKPAQRSGYEDDSQAGAIDIGDLIEKRVSSVLQREKQQSLEMQQKAWQAWNEIQSDEDYHLVKDQWEGKLRDPNFAIKLQAGTINPVDEYRRMLRDHYKGAVRLAAETIKSLTTGSAPPNVHVENSARVSADKTTEKTENEKTINSLREKVNKGKLMNEQEELAALQAVLLGGGGARR